eukprot:CAMPEP_0201475354 /NCGR_PEP_ID=MMETSP0151_2-20130828/774_1 /ASSEMBLY_ACC=CAM_ASM_000257 /TAXON_ID=200890 /ORGANISM="Paramoeba atlantica, Strain 621/1 / CCAP 1560/9" /LENGTH=406 /DNA_ID=CAMNT_0047855413 /DNA_START=192 /DNA_END=1409 /DNA_ORIENTATION=-
MPLKEVQWDYMRGAGLSPMNLKAVTGSVEACVNGEVTVHSSGIHDGTYRCSSVDLMSYISGAAMGTSVDTSDIWGATVNGRELAIVGHGDGTTFVDITDALNPIVLGYLPTFDCGEVRVGRCAKTRTWRDIKVYNNRAYIISENYGHGMQVVNMATLVEEARQQDFKLKDEVTILTADYDFDGFGKSHNIALNEETGYAYVIGSNMCNGGLYIVDVTEEEPIYAGCYADDGYTHDCQCVVYSSSFPDSRYHGHEICFNYNEDTLTIVDVTDKDDIVLVSRTEYKGSQYTHQGWLTEDGRYLLLDDELDEMQGTTYESETSDVEFGARTRTMIWNVEDLQNPFWATSFFSTQTVIDHNLYIQNNIGYQSNYCGGLRVLDVEDPLNIREIAYFDVAPYCDGPTFQGTW